MSASVPPFGGARSTSAAFSAQNASESVYRQSRSSAVRRSRKQCFAEPREAQLHEAQTQPAAEACRSERFALENICQPDTDVPARGVHV